jgi:Zn-dependent protease/CBS domain-containing protein
MFGGGGSIQLMRIFGIRIGVSTSWFVVLFLLIFLLSKSFKNVLGGSDTQAYLVAVGCALFFYASLVLHELGHALVARRLGIDVERIELWFFGGLAQLRGEPRTPGAEFAIAIAGPIVTLLVFVVCAAAAALVDSSSHFVDAALLRSSANASPAYVLLSFVAAMNLLLFAFNLVPGFPLDGGRIAFAAAWKITGDRNRALRIAGRGGVAFAYLLGALGLYLLARGDTGNGLWFVVLSWFLYGAARQAIVSGTVSDQLQRVTVADVMDPHPFTVDGDTTLLDASERVFEPHDWAFVPVVDGENRFLGVLRRDAAEAEIAAGRPALTAREAVAGDRQDWIIRTDQQLEDLLAQPSLRGPGAVFALDREDFLRGVVTIEQVRRAISPAPGQ